MNGEEPVRIETSFCEHCGDAIDRVPTDRGNSAVPSWVWAWTHHNSQLASCNCALERARPTMNKAGVPA